MHVVALATKSYLGTAEVHSDGLNVAVQGYSVHFTPGACSQLSFVPGACAKCSGNEINLEILCEALCGCGGIWKMGVDSTQIMCGCKRSICCCIGM